MWNKWSQRPENHHPAILAAEHLLGQNHLTLSTSSVVGVTATDLQGRHLSVSFNIPRSSHQIAKSTADYLKSGLLEVEFF